MSAFWRRRSDTCWLSLWPMKASWANAMPPQISAAPATTMTIIWRTPNELVRTLPTTVKALLCLMLRCLLGRQEGRDYIKWLARFFPALQHLRLAQVAESLALCAHRRLGRGK